MGCTGAASFNGDSGISWRRLLVPANITLDQLHAILQTAMGWQDSHLHQFRVHDRTFGRPDWEDAFDGEPQPEDERKARLDRIISGVGAKMIYSYDFGDDWKHEVVLEKILAPETGRHYPSCIDGEGHCPPEDCGGMPGYEDLLRVIRDRYHPEYQDTMSWLGAAFDPHEFSAETVNRNLRRTRTASGVRREASI